MGVFSILWHNLLGYDLIILLLGVANAAIGTLTWRQARRLSAMLRQTIFVPSRQQLRDIHEEELLELRRRTEGLYALFANVTAIFPLLGILGTVISLLPMVSALADMQQNFFAALTSTFWGLICAIGCKFFDGFLVSLMDDNERSVGLYLDRRDRILRQMHPERARHADKIEDEIGGAIGNEIGDEIEEIGDQIGAYTP